MRKPVAFVSFQLVMIAILVACESVPGTPSLSTLQAGTATARENVSQTATHRPTKTDLPTETVTPTATTVPTIIPMVSPSPGPAPDLELLNVTTTDDMLMGELRNNTDEAMIFPGEEPGLRVVFDNWIDWGVGLWLHGISFPYDVIPRNRQMNCILYPHETGVLMSDPNPEYEKDEKVDAVPYGAGKRVLSYEGVYRRWEEFRELRYFNDFPDVLGDFYHPQVENLEYTIEISDVILKGAAILINFDAIVALPPYGTGEYVPAWIVLYDHEGRIINILFNSNIQVCLVYGCPLTDRIHVYGAGCNRGMCLFANWAEPDQNLKWFEPIIRITPEDMRRVDHIRALVEIQDADMCEREVHWDWPKNP
jgi:hypothetical protein